ncbi:hypothetical protein BDV40DRAFT_76802 [Aspergillus tamarii]|uniref:Uncharacterized protein n=1 Tax=Aspergillus tamarii TaxID=41984 RepID=A0A5N6UE43_ASPTM|nr:hypothetical protein BDV40DRAFT_76802 [Aspergillus tamarii]
MLTVALLSMISQNYSSSVGLIVESRLLQARASDGDPGIFCSPTGPPSSQEHMGSFPPVDADASTSAGKHRGSSQLATPTSTTWPDHLIQKQGQWFSLHVRELRQPRHRDSLGIDMINPSTLILAGTAPLIRT